MAELLVEEQTSGNALFETLTAQAKGRSSKAKPADDDDDEDVVTPKKGARKNDEEETEDAEDDDDWDKEE
ncbi:MAG TPA: hypothetical protein VFZ78_06435, partial [Flavisolibacter sp.]